MGQRQEWVRNYRRQHRRLRNVTAKNWTFNRATHEVEQDGLEAGMRAVLAGGSVDSVNTRMLNGSLVPANQRTALYTR
jgi:hypothetical protein